MATLDDLPIPSLLDLLPRARPPTLLDVRLRRQQVLQEPRVKAKGLPSAAALSKLTDKQITDLYYQLMAKATKGALIMDLRNSTCCTNDSNSCRP